MCWIAGVGRHGDRCGCSGANYGGMGDCARAIGNGEGGSRADGVSHTIVGELRGLWAESGQSSDNLSHVGSLCSACRCSSGIVLDETESTSCRNTTGSRILVSRVAGIGSRGDWCWRDQGQATSSGDAARSIRILMSRVAGVCGGGV